MKTLFGAATSSNIMLFKSDRNAEMFSQVVDALLEIR